MTSDALIKAAKRAAEARFEAVNTVIAKAGQCIAGRATDITERPRSVDRFDPLLLLLACTPLYRLCAPRHGIVKLQLSRRGRTK